MVSKRGFTALMVYLLQLLLELCFMIVMQIHDLLLVLVIIFLEFSLIFASTSIICMLLFTVRSSLALSCKNHLLYSPMTTEAAAFSTSSSSQGTRYLPSFPLSTATRLNHISTLEGSSKKLQKQCVNFSNSWPTKHFDGTSQANSRKLTNQLSEDLLIFGKSTFEYYGLIQINMS